MSPSNKSSSSSIRWFESDNGPIFKLFDLGPLESKFICANEINHQSNIPILSTDVVDPYNINKTEMLNQLGIASVFLKNNTVYVQPSIWKTPNIKKMVKHNIQLIPISVGGLVDLNVLDYKVLYFKVELNAELQRNSI